MIRGTSLFRFEHNIGRPRADISKEDITSLRELNYSWTKIARMLGESRRTLYRRLEEFNIPHDDYTAISSSELDEVIASIKVNFRNDGEVMLQAHILRLGFKVPRSALRASIHRVDHERTIARRSQVIKRRTYCVPHPNALWHVDGNHKLIRFRLVIHAGVDGFSRAIVFIKCSNNNRASTVLESFLYGVSSFGTPTCVRTDHGGENVDIWRHMLSITNNNPSSIIAGSSTHNERVERMWRDMSRCVSSQFWSTFYSIESEGILDPLNDTDIFCLHYVFLPRINRALQEFQEAWNRHSMSTEGNMTPYQMFFEGLSVLQSCQQSNQLQSNDVHLVDAPDRVEVPGNLLLPCDHLSTLLHTSIQPLCTCTDFGKSLYSQAIQVVGTHLQSGCSTCTYN